MMKNLFILPLLVILGACSTIDRIDAVARPAIEAANDRALDRGHKLICNDTYRAEMAFIKRHNINAEIFRSFCARGNGETR